MLRLRLNYRFWAEAPSVSRVQLVADDGEVIGSTLRPTFPKGVCRHCGCSQFDACLDAFDEGCAWADRTERCCTNPKCLAAERRRKAQA